MDRFSNEEIKAASIILSWRLSGEHEGWLDSPLYGGDLSRDTLGYEKPERVHACLALMVAAGDWNQVRKGSK